MVNSEFSRRAGIAAVVGAIALIANRAFAQQNPPPASPPHVPPPHVPPEVIRERERILNEAERRLGEARELLFRAGHEYGGHRMRAIQMVDGAMAEINVSRRFLV